MKLCKLLKLIKIHKNLKTLTISSSLDSLESLNICMFFSLAGKKLNFHWRYTPWRWCKIWWQIFLFLSTHDSRYIIGSLKFLWKQMLILRLLKLSFKAFFAIFWNFKDPLAKSHCMNSIHWTKQTYKFS